MANEGSVVLQNAISIRDLTTIGTSLEINTDFKNSYDDDVQGDTQPEEGTIFNTFGTYIKIPFSELAKEMKSLDDYGFVKKKILSEGGGEPIGENSYITIIYSGYWEGERESFDFTPVSKPFSCALNESALFPGLQTAVASMLVGEVSQFLLSYHVMYGVMGNPPRIKPKSDCVFYIRLQRSIKNLDNRFQGETKYQRNCFKIVNDESKHLFITARDMFSKTNYQVAVKCFQKAVHILQTCRLADEKEQEKQEKFLLKLYLNLAICYNKMKKPLQACSMCNEIAYMTDIWKNSKALLYNARALIMIGEFRAAEKRLKVAIKISPNENALTTELQELHKKMNLYTRGEKVKKHIFNSEDEALTEDFKSSINEICKGLVGDEDIMRVTVPLGLNAKEKEYVSITCKKYGLIHKVSEKDVCFNKGEEDLYDDFNIE